MDERTHDDKIKDAKDVKTDADLRIAAARKRLHAADRKYKGYGKGPNDLSGTF